MDCDEALGESIVDALGDRLDGLTATLDRWSERCIAAGSFPPDPLKRAAARPPSAAG